MPALRPQVRLRERAVLVLVGLSEAREPTRMALDVAGDCGVAHSCSPRHVEQL